MAYAKSVPMPRCVFMLVNLTVPVKFLFSLHYVVNIDELY